MPRLSVRILALVSLAALLVACHPTAGPAASQPPPVAPTPPPSPTGTALPAPTPTFDPAASVTRTPAPPAACPTLNATAIFTFTANLLTVEKELLAYLNSGGEPGRLQAAFDAWNAESVSQGGRVVKMDLTGDGVPEILVDVYQDVAVWVAEW